MRTFKLILLLIICQSILYLHAQLSTNEQPFSFRSENAHIFNARNAISAKMAKFPTTVEKLEKSDAETEKLGDKPVRFGYPISVDWNITNSGTWLNLENGDKLWQLEINSPGALSINLLYDKFWLPEGASFFIYSKDKKQYMGAFTSRNNKGTFEQPRGFATGFIYGDNTVLEYYQPAHVTGTAIISIQSVVYGYRYINIPEILRDEANIGYNQSGDCQVNINCPEGEDWQAEKRAVALMVGDGMLYGTGALINNTAQNKLPLFLTANHCLDLEYWKYDAISKPNMDQYMFYWNYEAPSCSNGSMEPAKLSTTGAKVLANNEYSDFALLSLTEDPKDLTGYEPSYLGWDRTTSLGLAGVVGIHHPSGDVKKIATSFNLPTNSATYWQVYWSQTSNGFSVTEGGSSGSPLLTRNTHRVIGQLYGGPSVNCSAPAKDYGLYGQFHISWDYGTSPQRRLKDWLDPMNTGAQFIDGIPSFDFDPYVIHIEGKFNQSNCPFLPNQTPVDHWGGTYQVCRNEEITLHFTSNKKNLTCDLWYGEGAFYLNYFERGDYYRLTCTPRSDIFELCFTDGTRTEYIAFETQDYYNITYTQSTQLIQINMKQEITRTNNNNSYKIVIYDQAGGSRKSLPMTSSTLSISTADFSNGIYFVHILDKNGKKIGMRKISVSH